MGFNDVSAPGRAIEAGSGRSRGCERRARRRQFGTRLTRTARIGRARLGVEKTPGEDVRDWSRGKDARAFSPGGSEIRRLRDLTSKPRACVRACASASGPPHGPTPHALATGSFSRLLNATKIFSTRDPHWPRRGFYPRFTDSAPRALQSFGSARSQLADILEETRQEQKAYNGQEKKSAFLHAEISAISCHERKRRAGERRSVFVRSWLSSTDRESRASRVHDPPLAQRTRFPRSARRSDPIRRAIRWRTRRTRLSAPSARGRQATPHRG